MSKPAQTSVMPSHIGGLVTLRRVVINSTSLLTNDVLTRAATFIVYALVARYCGPRAFGQLSLGLMLLYTFQVFASAGLPVLITREVARQPKLSGRYFANASLIAAAAFVVSIGVLWLLVIVSQYPADTSEIILLLGLGILPWSLTMITTSLLQAWERMHFIVLIAIPVNAAKIGVSYYVLSMGYGVRAVAIVFLGCHIATLLLQWPVLLLYMQWREVALDLAFCRALLKRTWRFLGIDSLLAVWASVNTLLLSWFAGEAAVGLFGAAWQLLVPVSITFQAIVNSLFPILCRHADDNPRRFQQLAILTLEVLAIVAVPGCILLYFGAGPIISLVYGNEDFAGSVLVLRIILPMLLLQAISTALGQVLFSQHQEHVTLRIIAIVVLFNVVCGTGLIYVFGLVGAAVTVLLTWIVNTHLHIAAARQWLRDGARQPFSWRTTLIWSIVAAGGVMATMLAFSDPFDFLFTSVLTSLLYLMVLAGLVYVACGGWIGMRERFLTPLREQ